jgi:hypothetical protein
VLGYRNGILNRGQPTLHYSILSLFTISLYSVAMRLLVVLAQEILPYRCHWGADDHVDMIP